MVFIKSDVAWKVTTAVIRNVKRSEGDEGFKTSFEDSQITAENSRIKLFGDSKRPSRDLEEIPQKTHRGVFVRLGELLLLLQYDPPT